MTLIDNSIVMRDAYYKCTCNASTGKMIIKNRLCGVKLSYKGRMVDALGQRADEGRCKMR